MLEELKESIGDAFTPELQKELENKINNLVEARAQVLADELIENKSNNLDEHCEDFKDQLAEESKKIVDEKLEHIAEMVEKYIDCAVNEFVSEHEEKFTVSESEMMVDAAKHMVANACRVAGVSICEIDEDRSKGEYNTNESQRNLDLLGAMYEQHKKIVDMKKQNDNLMKLGVINELKEGMSLAESEKFERIAMSVPFEQSRNFLNHLENIKESIINENDDSDDYDDYDDHNNMNESYEPSAKRHIEDHSSETSMFSRMKNFI